MAAAECPVAELQPIVENLPEFVELVCPGLLRFFDSRAGNIDQVDRDNTLIEAAIVLVLPRRIVPRLCLVSIVAEPFRLLLVVRCQEASATHARVDIPLELLHLLRGDVVRHHSLRCALCSKLRQIPVPGVLCDVVLIQHIDQLRERRRDPHALLILDALHPLAEHFLNQHCKVFPGLPLRHLVQVHEHRHKRCLAVAGHQRDQLILNRLDSPCDLILQTDLRDRLNLLLVDLFTNRLELLRRLFSEFLSADVDKRCQMRQREGLPAILVGCHLRDDLRCNVRRCVEAVRLLNQCLADDRPVLKHILQIDQIAVVFLLRIIVRIMKMDDPRFMRPDNFLRKQDSAAQISADLSGHVVTLSGVDDRVLVGVLLLHFLIVLLDQRQNTIVRRVGLARKRPLIAVADILLCHLKAAHLHDAGLDHVLDVLDIHRMWRLADLAGDVLGHRADLHITHLVDRIHFLVRLRDGIENLLNVKRNFLSVALDHVRLYILFHDNSAPSH